MTLKNILAVSVLLLLAGCQKYLDNSQLPSNTIAGEDAFVSDNSTSAIVTGCFLSLNSGAYSGGTGSNLAFLTALYTDETKAIATGASNVVAFYGDNLNSSINSWWTDFYSKIYVVNGAIEGIQQTKSTLYNKNQWLGESYFVRAFLYFQLVNYYGDAVLALTTDYKLNATLGRSPRAQVYQQIISDLKQAQDLLGADYKDGFGSTTTYRVRPNKAVATALLAKTYLYTGQYDSAEAQASAVIANTAYKLEAPAQVFLTGSNETIWALATASDTKTNEYGFYNNGMPATLSTDPGKIVQAAMASQLLNAFEPGDARYANWVRSTVYTGTPAATYYFPNKYKSVTGGTEKTVMLRLAELYLIRAEARARQNRVTGANSAETDLDLVRTRAGLSPTTAATQPAMLDAILHERQVELFTEGSNRFLDLKRTGAIDAVMTVVAAAKGATWSSYKQLFPLPPNDMTLDPNIAPNPGY